MGPSEIQSSGIVGPMPQNPMDLSGLVSRLSAMAATGPPQYPRANPTMPHPYNPQMISVGQQYPGVGYLQPTMLHQKRGADETNVDEGGGPPAKRQQAGG